MLSLDFGSLSGEQRALLSLALRLHGPAVLRDVWKTATEKYGGVDASSLREALLAMRCSVEEHPDDAGVRSQEGMSSDSGPASHGDGPGESSEPVLGRGYGSSRSARPRTRR
ncbi:hypothetical protein ACIOKD_41450 [Streptomyces sp. NPDC087844]|uniref:hypothetical protein n=1 Tax=Streptomyces sp. NPDC087844 TaxID=3365805 RepID=UPI003827A5C7